MTKRKGFNPLVGFVVIILIAIFAFVAIPGLSSMFQVSPFGPPIECASDTSPNLLCVLTQ